MSANQPRVRASWYPPIVSGLLVLLGLAIWIIPVRVEHVITDSTGGESRTVTAWDTSHWHAVSAVWCETVLLCPTMIVLSSISCYSRSCTFARSTAARCFLASLLIHGLLLLWLWGLPVARGVVERAEVIRVSQSNQLLDELRATGPSAQPAYEKVADLKPE